MRTSEQRAREVGKGLTEDDVRAIRALPPPLKPIAEQFGVSIPMISLIRNRRKWRHVKSPSIWIGHD